MLDASRAIDEPAAEPRRCVCLPIRLHYYGCLCGAVPQRGLNAAADDEAAEGDEIIQDEA